MFLAMDGQSHKVLLVKKGLQCNKQKNTQPNLLLCNGVLWTIVGDNNARSCKLFQLSPSMAYYYYYNNSTTTSPGDDNDDSLAYWDVPYKLPYWPPFTQFSPRSHSKAFSLWPIASQQQR
jgi:hypothetical protein